MLSLGVIGQRGLYVEFVSNWPERAYVEFVCDWSGRALC